MQQHNQNEVNDLVYRLIGAMHLGFRIEQYSGHRWIFHDEHSDNLDHDELKKVVDIDVCFKIYESVNVCLDLIDNWIEKLDVKPLVQHGKGNFNHFNDFEVLLGPHGLTVGF